MTHTPTPAVTAAHAQHHDTRRAFTLIEMVVSLTVISIVFLAMGSVMLLAGKAMPGSDDTAARYAETSDALQQIVSELQTATVIAATTDKSIHFKIPDRTGDGHEELLAYVWSGTANDPLYRIYNSRPPVAVIPGLYEFNLAFDVKTVTTHSNPVQSPEVLHVSHDPAVGELDISIKSNKWLGQCIYPSALPADAVSWSVTRVEIQAKKRGGSSGETQVQIRPETPAHEPHTTILEEYTMLESDLGSSYAWQTFNYSSVTGVEVGSNLFVVLQWVSDTDSAEVLYDNLAGAGLLMTANSGGAWTMMNSQALVYNVYGTYTTASSTQVDSLRSITIQANPGQTPATRLQTAVKPLNRPVMP